MEKDRIVATVAGLRGEVTIYPDAAGVDAVEELATTIENEERWLDASVGTKVGMRIRTSAIVAYQIDRAHVETDAERAAREREGTLKAVGLWGKRHRDPKQS